MNTTLHENIDWVGAIDWNIRDFHGYDTERGSSYNAYLGFVGKGLTRPIVILSVAKNLRNWARSFATLRMTGGFSDKA